MAGEREIRQAYRAILANDFEQAIVWFEKAIAFDPDNAAFHYKLSITCARSNRLKKAIEHARRAMEIDPGKEIHRLHFNHLQAKELLERAGKCFGESQKQLDCAERILGEAVALDPLSIEAFFLLALVNHSMGKREDALKAVQEVLRLDPHDENGNRLMEEISSNLSPKIING